jgi:hypothetical protein
MNLSSAVKHPGFVWSLISIPIFLFAIYIFKYAVNVPYMDDMELVGSVNTLKDGDYSSFLSLLIRQQNDHRSAFPRLGIFASYLLSGTLDFRLTILLGYLNLILLGYSLFLVLRSTGGSLAAFLPISLLVFSPMVFEVHLMSLTAFQHTLSISFSILCLFFLQPGRTGQWIWSLFFAVLAGVTNLDGVSVMFVGVFWLVTQKRWKEATVCVLFLVAALILYFSDFHFSNKMPILINSQTIPLIFHCFIVGTGSLAKIISDAQSVPISFVFGVGVILTFFFARVQYVTTHGIKKVFSFNLTEIVFLKLLLTMVIIAVGRFSTGAETMIAGRFSVYSVSIGAIFYIMILNIFKERSEKKVVVLSVLCAFTLTAYSYFKYESAVDYFKGGMVADTYNYPKNGIFLYQYVNMMDPDPSFYRNYIFPTYFSDGTVSEWRHQIKQSKPSPQIHWTVQDFAAGEVLSDHLYGMRAVLIQCDDPSVPAGEIQMLLQKSDATGPAYIAALKHKRGNRLLRLLQPISGRSFQVEIMRKLPRGDYKMALVWTREGKAESRLLNSTITL